MNRKVRKNVNNRGQAVIETFLVLGLIAGIASFTWIFHQGFVIKNLYGGEGSSDKSLGIEQVVSHDYP